MSKKRALKILKGSSKCKDISETYFGSLLHLTDLRLQVKPKDVYSISKHSFWGKKKNDGLFLGNRWQNIQSDLSYMSSEIYCLKGDELHAVFYLLRFDNGYV